MRRTAPDNDAPSGLWIIECPVFGDGRGAFCETWSRRAFADVGLDHDWVQDNEAVSTQQGTVRGLHFQAPPHGQSKLVRVVRGKIADVAVDVRRGSPTYGRHTRIELTAGDGRHFLVPQGFLHGYMTLEPDTVVLYKVDSPYAKAAEGAVAWNDPDLAIDWGDVAKRAIVSDKDVAAPSFADFESPFVYQEHLDT